MAGIAREVAAEVRGWDQDRLRALTGAGESTSRLVLMTGRCREASAPLSVVLITGLFLCSHDTAAGAPGARDPGQRGGSHNAFHDSASKATPTISTLSQP